MKILVKFMGLLVYGLILASLIYVDITAELSHAGHLGFGLLISVIVVCGVGVYLNGDASSDPKVINNLAE